MSKLKTGQVTVSASAQPLTSLAIECQGFVIKAAKANAGTSYLGDSTVSATTGYALEPGETFEYERNISSASALYTLSVQDFYVIGTAPDKVTWLASQ